MSEANRGVGSDDPDTHLLAVVEGRLPVAAVVADFGTNLEQVVEVVAEPDRMARICVREACPFAFLIDPVFVADRDVVLLRDLELGVVHNAVGCGNTRDLSAEPAAAKLI